MKMKKKNLKNILLKIVKYPKMRIILLEQIHVYYLWKMKNIIILINKLIIKKLK